MASIIILWIFRHREVKNSLLGPRYYRREVPKIQEIFTKKKIKKIWLGCDERIERKGKISMEETVMSTRLPDSLVWVWSTSLHYKANTMKSLPRPPFYSLIHLIDNPSYPKKTALPSNTNSIFQLLHSQLRVFSTAHVISIHLS
jgi:hypothetical protein